MAVIEFTALQLVDMIRQQTKQTASTGADDRWTDTNIINLLNAGLGVLASIGGVFEVDQEGTGMVATVRTVDIPRNFRGLYQVIFDDDSEAGRLTFVPAKDWNFENPDAGNPTHFTIWNRKVWLDPVPDTTAATKQLRFLGLGIPQALPDPPDTTVPEVPGEFQFGLVLFVKSMIDDAEDGPESDAKNWYEVFRRDFAKQYRAKYGRRHEKLMQGIHPVTPLQDPYPTEFDRF